MEYKQHKDQVEVTVLDPSDDHIVYVTHVYYMMT